MTVLEKRFGGLASRGGFRASFEAGTGGFRRSLRGGSDSASKLIVMGTEWQWEPKLWPPPYERPPTLRGSVGSGVSGGSEHLEPSCSIGGGQSSV